MTRLPSLRIPAAIAVAFAAPLWLAACRDTAHPGNSVIAGAAYSGSDGGVHAEAGPRQTTTSPGASVASRAGSGPDYKGEEGARAVLREWAGALEHGDLARARALWGHGGSDSGFDPDSFAAAYARYKSITVVYGHGIVEGAAGSLYYQVPVTLYGRLRDGRTYRLEGTVTLRRVNDVDGASADELRWHITQSDLTPRP